MKSIISLVTILFVQLVFAQSEGRSQNVYVNNGFLSAGNGSLSLKAPSKGDTQGSMYLYEQFSAVKAGGILQDFLARYNAYEDRMEFQSGDKIYEYYPNINDKEFQIINLNKTYAYLNYFLDETRSENGYLVISQRGAKYTLYKKEHIKLQEGRVSQTGYDKTVPDRYIAEKDDYYIGIKDSTIIKIPKSKKDFAKLFGENQKKILDLINSGSYSLKEENSLQKLFIQLNSNF